MDYIAPASCADVAFRTMWAEFEWENKVYLSLLSFIWRFFNLRLKKKNYGSTFYCSYQPPVPSFHLKKLHAKQHLGLSSIQSLHFKSNMVDLYITVSVE
jgi:vesicle coat complex subunit